MKIFCPKSDVAVETASRINPSFGINPSFVSQQLKTVKKNSRKPSAVTPTSKISQVGLSRKSDKPVTVTLINSDVYTLPKDKEKKQLRTECKMGCCTFCESDLGSYTIAARQINSFYASHEKRGII